MAENKVDYGIPNMLPKEIVEKLDRYIIGQDEAKKSIAIAIRNRYRRSKLSKEKQEETFPSNLLMIGPTGVGKTEIVRRVSKIIGSPYVKVEATKFTEVGYVGRDVESMVRDLVEASIALLKKEKRKLFMEMAEKNAIERLLDLLVPYPQKEKTTSSPFDMLFSNIHTPNLSSDEVKYRDDQKHIFREKLKRHEMDEQYIEIEVDEKFYANDLISATGMDQVNDMMKNLLSSKKKRRVTVNEAKTILTEEEADKLIDEVQLNQEAIQLAENSGIIFIDEIDKIAESGGMQGDSRVSREGVQRDILPIIEGCTIKTKYGNVRTDHILFIAAGAFHVAKPEDLIPELQGRFAVKVKLNSLTQADFVKILSETDYSIIEAYKELLSVDKTYLNFTLEGIDAIATYAYLLNEEENLGARRLTSIIEKLLFEIQFEAGESEKSIVIDREYVNKICKFDSDVNNYSKYVL